MDANRAFSAGALDGLLESVAVIAPAAAEVITQPVLSLGEGPTVTVPVVLKQLLPVVSMARDADAFGRIALVGRPRSGGILVMDDQPQRDATFDHPGRLTQPVDRQRHGRGEFERP